MRVLENARLRLELQAAGHAEEMFPLLSDPALYRHEGEPPASLAWLRERYARLESRRSADGRELWLNWIVRLPTGEAAGFVQATVLPDGTAAIAYVLGSSYWGRGLASAAVRLMIDDLVARHGVGALSAVVVRSNAPSLRLLSRLGFTPASPAAQAAADIAPAELLLHRSATSAEPRPPA